MAPTVRFTREQIVDAAFEIARTKGIEGITIRGIAAALGCSIAPIYVNFAQIEDVRRAVADKAVDQSRRILAEVQSGSPFQDIGTASIRFAREFPVIFRDLVLSPNGYLPGPGQDPDPGLVAQMREDPDLAGLEDVELQKLLLKMRVFQMGLAVAAMNGVLAQDTAETEVVELMNETARDLVRSALSRAGQ